MPARRIPLQRRSLSGLFWSMKGGGRQIPYESALELDYCTLLELDPAVESFDSQPVAVQYRRASGRLCTGFPDFLVHYTGRPGKPPDLVDVKYHAEIMERWPELKPRFRGACSYARNHGWLFRLRTDRHIRTPALRNAQYLLRYLREGADAEDEAHIVRTLTSSGAQTIGEFLALAYPAAVDRARALPTFWNLVARRVVQADFTTALSMDTSIGFSPG